MWHQCKCLDRAPHAIRSHNRVHALACRSNTSPGCDLRHRNRRTEVADITANNNFAGVWPTKNNDDNSTSSSDSSDSDPDDSTYDPATDNSEPDSNDKDDNEDSNLSKDDEDIASQPNAP